MNKPTKKPLTAPTGNYLNSNKYILTKSLTPIKILGLMGDEEFNEFIHEWAYFFLNSDNKYEKIEELDGSGDKGRDFIAYEDYKNEIWINYQCKNYSKKLSPSDIWVELGKICYHCFNGSFKNPPKEYFFVTSKGVGNTVHDLLKDPNKLMKGLMDNWETHCKTKITKEQNILLEGDFLNFVKSFNFSIFNYIPPKELLKQFEKSPYYTQRFGQIIKPREIPQEAPEVIEEKESIYIKKILDAYGDALGKKINLAKELDKFPELKKDFNRQRLCFCTAELLKIHSREIYDPDLKVFESLQDEIYDGIIDIIEADAKNGFEKLRKVLNHAKELQITNNVLVDQLKVNDRKGICHQLANEKEEVKWI